MISAPSSTRKWDVIGVGENSVDSVLRLPAAPETDGPNAKMRITAHAQHCGGQIVTALATCATLGLRTKYIGATGNDANGALIQAALDTLHIDTAHVVTRTAPNRFAVILIDDRTGERIVLWDKDDALALSDAELPEEVFASTRLVHVDTVDMRAALRAARLSRAAGALVTTDIDRVTDGVEELISLASFPIFSEHFLAEFTGESDAVSALRRLRQITPSLLTVTRGAEGALALDRDAVIEAPGIRVTAVDTTGAGDVFRGAFIYALLNGESVPDTLRFANAAAAVSCTKEGALRGASTAIRSVFRPC